LKAFSFSGLLRVINANEFFSEKIIVLKFTLRY